MRKIQIGSELEYEVGVNKIYARNDLIGKKNPLIDKVTYDCSLHNGIEINTIYTTLSGWKNKEIKELTNELKEYKANNDAHTAGQHIHLSGYDQLPILQKMDAYRNEVQNFLYPISGRYRQVRCSDGHLASASYGLGWDMWRYNSEFGTLEIRAFAASLKASVIKNRMIVVRELYKFLASNKPFSELFSSLTKRGKRAYKALLQDKDNPHEFGENVEVMLQKL